MIAEVDTDKSGTIEWKEFVTVATKVKGGKATSGVGKSLAMMLGAPAPKPTRKAESGPKLKKSTSGVIYGHEKPAEGGIPDGEKKVRRVKKSASASAVNKTGAGKVEERPPGSFPAICCKGCATKGGMIDGKLTLACPQCMKRNPKNVQSGMHLTYLCQKCGSGANSKKRDNCVVCNKPTYSSADRFEGRTCMKHGAPQRCMACSTVYIDEKKVNERRKQQQR